MYWLLIAYLILGGIGAMAFIPGPPRDVKPAYVPPEPVQSPVNDYEGSVASAVHRGVRSRASGALKYVARHASRVWVRPSAYVRRHARRGARYYDTLHAGVGVFFDQPAMTGRHALEKAQ